MPGNIGKTLPGTGLQGEVTCQAWRAYRAKYIMTPMQILEKNSEEDREKILGQLLATH